MPSNKEHFGLDIFDKSSVAYCVAELVLDADGKPTDWIYRYCNQAFADIKGYRLETMIDHSFLSLYPELDEKWLNACYRAAYEDIPCETDLMNRQRYHFAIMPVGRKGFCSIMIYKHSESEISEQDKALTDEGYIIRQLFPEFVSLYKIELNSGKYEVLRLSGNTNASKIAKNNANTFATYDEYCLHYAELFIPEDEREEFLDWHTCANMKKRLLETDRITYHYHSVSKDGNHSYYEAYAVKGTVSGDSFQIFLGYRNIDSILYKEKAVQEQLKKALAETQLRSEIISSIAKTYQYVSRIDIQADWFEEISNRDKENLNFAKSGKLSDGNLKMCRQCIAEEYQEAFLKFTDLKTMPDRMADEETIVMEYQMKNGTWHKLRFIEKKRDENGRLTHVICVIRSISDAKRKEQSLLHQIAQAKKETALRTRFLSNMSHDIRTPMNGIIGMIDLMNHYPNDLEMQQKCRDKVLESSKYLVSLVNDILDMNKLESGDTVDRELTFDLTEILNRSNTAKQTAAAEKNIEYIVDWDKAEIRHSCLVGNPFYLERLLTAISDNAVKFTPSGGCVRVWCAEKTESGERTVYEFGCEDNGIGMSESFLEHAFDIFSQENETSRSKYEGTGLGLAISKKLADKLGGTIEIKSQKGVGTTVLMTIPFRIGKAENLKKPKKHGEVSVKGLRALVAEDNDLNREILECMLENIGITAECVCDGLGAVQKFESSPQGYYDLILMDIMMPNMNGWDAARKIRSLKRSDSADVPMIALSANAFAEDIINSRILGMNDHITKPLNETKLLNSIKECISEKRSDI